MQALGVLAVRELAVALGGAAPSGRTTTRGGQSLPPDLPGFRPGEVRPVTCPFLGCRVRRWMGACVCVLLAGSACVAGHPHGVGPTEAPVRLKG